MYLAGLIEYIIFCVGFLLWDPLLLLPFAFELVGQGCELGTVYHISLALVFAAIFVVVAGVARLIIFTCSARTTPQMVILFTIGITVGYLHHSAQSRNVRATEFESQLSVPHALLEGTDRLVFSDVLDRLCRVVHL